MNDLMLRVLVVAIAANVVLVIVVLIRSRLTRPGHDLAMATAGQAVPDGLAPAIVASGEPEAFPDAPDPGASSMSLDQVAHTTGEEPDMSVNAEEPTRAHRFAMREDEDHPSDESVHAFLSAGVGPAAPTQDLFDYDTGLRTGLAWDEAMVHEESRRARYGHPVTVVIAELDRLDALARQLGQENADRLLRPVAQAMLTNARAADVVARLGHHRFGVLLPETDEIRAINYVERIRLACDGWLDAAAVSVRLAIGWASAPSGGDLTDAFRVAERRMHADRSGDRSTEPTVPSRTYMPPSSPVPEALATAPTAASTIGTAPEPAVEPDQDPEASSSTGSPATTPEALAG